MDAQAGATEGKVAVITGASSGIGRAAALAFSQRGFDPVLVSRQQEALDQLAAQCAGKGGTLAMAADVADEHAVAALVRRTVADFGRIDVWVNNAAVTLFGELDMVPPEDFRRVIDTNLMGYVNGARAVLPVFRQQRNGVLINVSSMVGRMGQALASAYVVSKFGVMGFSAALRQDLIDEKDIHVVTVIPPSVDTPLFQHGGNYTGRLARPISPVFSAEKIAAAIVDAALEPQKEIVIGMQAKMGLLAYRFYPELVERVSPRIVRRRHFQDRPQPPSHGNLFEPDPEWNTISGGWAQQARKKTAFRLAAVITASAALFLMRSLTRRQR